MYVSHYDWERTEKSSAEGFCPYLMSLVYNKRAWSRSEIVYRCWWSETTYHL